MTLLVLEEALEDVKEIVEELGFSQILRECREAIGIKQYKAAEFIGVPGTRMKNLETGYFRHMPMLGEIQGLARLYDLNPNMLEKKAEEHVCERRLRTRVRTPERE